MCASIWMFVCVWVCLSLCIILLAHEYLCPCVIMHMCVWLCLPLCVCLNVFVSMFVYMPVRAFSNIFVNECVSVSVYLADICFHVYFSFSLSLSPTWTPLSLSLYLSA